MNPIRVGLIDDEPQALKVFKWEFGDRFDIHTFISGEAALEALDNGLEVDVIISDQRMPKIAGDSVLVEIRRRCPDTQLLITTAYADVEPLRRCVNEAGVVGYIEKPWKPEVIVKMVKDARVNQLLKKADGDKTQELIDKWREKVSQKRMNDVRSVCEALKIPAHIAEKYRHVVKRISKHYNAHWTDVGLMSVESVEEDDRLALELLRSARTINSGARKRSLNYRGDKIPLAFTLTLIQRCRGKHGPAFDVTKEKGRLTVNVDAGGGFGDSYLDPLASRDGEMHFRNALLLLALHEIEKISGSLKIDQRNDRLMGSITFQI
jgi:CheY-like chemotaxis protein